MRTGHSCPGCIDGLEDMYEYFHTSLMHNIMEYLFNLCCEKDPPVLQKRDRDRDRARQAGRQTDRVAERGGERVADRLRHCETRDIEI